MGRCMDEYLDVMEVLSHFSKKGFLCKEEHILKTSLDQDLTACLLWPFSRQCP